MDIGRLSSVVFLFAGLVFLVPTTEAVELRPVGFDLEYAESIEKIVRSGIESGEMPGAVVVVAGPSQVHYAKAFGRRSVEPVATDMTLDTLFDLASLTKPIATGTSVMKLVSDDKVNVEATVVTYLPEFKGQDKEQIRVRDLLLHIGGLIPDNSLRDYEDGPEEAWKRICDLKPIAAPGEKFAYTDVGFIVLG